MSRPVRAAMAALAAFVAIAGVAHAATTTTECGLFRDFVAPDPIAVTTGSITFGLSGSPEVIAADATLAPPADTNLAGLAGGAPTALTIVRDAGMITSLAFAPECSISGPVTLIPDLFGAGADGYVIADRVFAPVDIVQDNSGLNALIATAADSGSPLTLAFTIDVSSGVPAAFAADVSFSGMVVVENDGDIRVGDATLVDPIVDQGSRAELEEAADLGVAATVAVAGDGIPDQSMPGGVDMAITLDVSFEAPTATPTEPAIPDTAAPHAAVDSGGPGAFALGLLLLIGASLATQRRRWFSPSSSLMDREPTGR